MQPAHLRHVGRLRPADELDEFAQRVRERLVQPVHLLHVHFQPHAAHLQQRVGGDGGAVSEKTDVSGRDALGNESPEPLEHAQRGIFRRARDLLD